jgi:fructose-1,6-bisphosphatase
MLALFIISPIDLSGYVGVLVPVGAIIAIIAARILYKKDKL